MTTATGVVAATNLSEGWLRTLRSVSDAPERRLFHTVTRITDPCREEPPIRDAANRLLRKLGHASVETVANTIFPARLAASSRDHEVLVSRYLAIYPKIKHAHKDNARGTYFGRIVAHPNGKDDLDQLSVLIGRLRFETTQRGPKSARYEVGVAGPASEEIDFADSFDTYAAGRDNSIMGFPCLSFCSLQLDRGSLHLIAHYRSQWLVQRGYGNYLGLARLQAYIAEQAGIVPGHLTIVAGCARAEAAKYQINLTTDGLLEGSELL
jgi:hypothetical protein